MGKEMTDKQPEALWLADEFESTKSYMGAKAAAELRRLHKANAELSEALKLAISRIKEDWKDLDYEYGGSDKLGDIEASVAEQRPSIKDIRFIRAAIRARGQS